LRQDDQVGLLVCRTVPAGRAVPYAPARGGPHVRGRRHCLHEMPPFRQPVSPSRTGGPVGTSPCWSRRSSDGSFGCALPRALLLRLASEALVFRPLQALLIERLSHFTFLCRIHDIRIVGLFAGGA